MNETFKVGQTVWRPNGIKCRFVGQDLRDGRTTAWIDEENDGGYELVDLNDLTATDPDAEPAPQKCPFCGGKASLHGTCSRDGWFYVSCDGRNPDACVSSPSKPTRLEAIQAWNSIRIATALDMQKEFMAKEAASHAERLFTAKPADSDPLTETWLGRVGLGWPGIKKSECVSFVLSGGVGRFKDVNGLGIAIELPSIKTIGDARTLCRLLGVPLKE